MAARVSVADILNEMTLRHSKSVLSKIRVYINSMLDEAVELAMLPKIRLAGSLYRSPESAGQRSTSRLKKFPKSCSI